MTNKPFSVDQTISRAKSHAKKSEIKQARSLYHSILERFPNNKRAIQGLDALASGAGKPACTSVAQSDLEAVVALYSKGRLQEALNKTRELIAAHPNAPIPHNLSGLIYANMQRHDDAIASYQRALRLKPDFAEAHNNLGTALMAQRKLNEAVASYQRALQLQPNLAEIHNNLGSALTDQGKLDEAILSLKRALQIQPKLVEAYNNLGNIFYLQKRYYEAILIYRELLNINHTHIYAMSILIYCLIYICEWDSEIKYFDKNIFKFNSDNKFSIQSYCILSIIDDGIFHRKISEAYASSFYMRDVVKMDKYPLRDKIKIGYYSADFYNHATMYLMAELFELHDKSRFEVHVFSFGPDSNDEMRQRLITAVGHFHDVRSLSDKEIADRSRQIGIDIAVDLKGFTQNARVGIFALRAAPIQIVWLGYPGTMGADFIDYIIADPVVIPESHKEYYTEKVAYLPDSYQINDRKRAISDAPMTRADQGLPETGFVFCCFNNNYKISPKEYDIWMRLLKAVDGSVLWLLQDNDIARDNLRKEAQSRGVDPERIIFAKRAPLDQHLARQRFADLFLDTFNCNAHTTASDALWVGLPLITCMGNSFASRVAGSLLTAVGLPELITTSHADYETLALELATNPEKLAAIRQKLHDNIPAAPLFDSARFTKNIEKAYEIMVQKYQNDEAPDHFYV